MTQQQQRQQQQQQQREHPDADLDVTPCSTQTLAQFVKLAQDYKGWSRSQLARVLGRDATKIVPQSGNPKLDLVTNLARVLEWSIGDVAEMLAGATEDAIPPAQCDGMSPAEVIQAGQAANAQRDFPAAVAYGEWGEVVGEDDERRAAAINIQAIAWDGLGRYEKNIACLRRGLGFLELGQSRRRLLQTNLASSHLVFGDLDEALALATYLIGTYATIGPLELRDHCNVAFSHYVRAHALRRLAPISGAAESWHQAIESFQICQFMYANVLRTQASPTPRALVHICEGAILECDAAVNPGRAPQILDRIVAEIERYPGQDSAPSSQFYCAVGWWCVFGCNIAARLVDESAKVRTLAVLTNKAHEVAEVCNDWSLWQRVLTLEYVRRQDVNRDAGGPGPWVIDGEDVRILVGVMGRFPLFRQHAWGILSQAEIVEGRAI